jgi:aryl-alcohol dehydrogenase-like predicted oxidoreductase
MERSLKRLKTDCVDLIQLHSCDLDDLKKGEVIEALQTMRKKGQTRYLGYSGDGEAALYAIQSGVFDSLQTSANLADQEAITLTLPEAEKAEMGVIIKRPIANAAWRYPTVPDNAYHQPYWERLQTLDYPFLKDNSKQSASIALRFTLGLPGVSTMIVGTTRPGRWSENAALLAEGPLPHELCEEIRERWAKVAEPSWIGLT